MSLMPEYKNQSLVAVSCFAALAHILVFYPCDFYTFTGTIATLTYRRFMLTSVVKDFTVFTDVSIEVWIMSVFCILLRGSKRGLEQLFRGLFDSVTIGKTYGF